MKALPFSRAFFVITATMMLYVIPLSAQPADCAKHCGEHAKGPCHEMKGLNLTEKQKTKLQELRIEHKPAMVKIKETMKLIKQKSKVELLKDKPDKALLKKYSQEIADQSRIMAESMTEHLLKVKKVLTKEQFEKMLSKEFFHGKQKMKMHGKNKKGCKGPSPEM